MKKLMIILVIFILMSFSVFAVAYERGSETLSQLTYTKPVFLTKNKYMKFPANLEYNIETETGKPFQKSSFIRDHFTEKRIYDEYPTYIDPMGTYGWIRYRSVPQFNYDEKEFMAKRQREYELTYAKIKYFDIRRSSFVENLLEKAIKTRNKVWI